MPLTLARDISPPPRLFKRRKRSTRATSRSEENDVKGDESPNDIEPTLAAVEAGKAKIEQHLAYFTEHLTRFSRTTEDHMPRVSINEWTELYASNEHEHGNHFVIHQHNHPISGVHYDLRLQFSKSSSMSFAVPKGLPGNPNSRSLGRMAIETRVHNFWNHLIESASPKTGSLLIWDTGTYSVLPRKNASKKPPSPQTTDDESDGEPTVIPDATIPGTKYENEKLIEAFQTRYIRLRLHGTRLPSNYTITMRLPSANDFSKPRATLRRNRQKFKPRAQLQSTDSEQEAEDAAATTAQEDGEQDLDTDSDEDAQTRINNAYPGSTNSVGSIHQRQWFVLLDRASSGFVQDKGTGNWARRGDQEGEGFETFFVRGRDVERSVVTGRLATEVESDEGVEGFVGRSGWAGISG